MRAAFICALMALTISGATAAEDKLVFVVSYHNLDYAVEACRSFLAAAPDAERAIRDQAKTQYVYELDDWVKEVVAKAAECRSVRDPRELGRRLENDPMNSLAVNTRCAGVTVIREPHPDFDKRPLSEANQRLKEQRPHWDLMLDYNGKNPFGWTLFPMKAGYLNGYFGELVEGEGNVVEAANQICIVVTGKGATIR
jgi:hypothetical protein